MVWRNRILRLATKESWRNRETGEWESGTEWHRVIAFGKLGEFAASLTKGAHIEVEGTLQSRERIAERKGSTQSNPKTLIYRSWSIRVDSIRKLDRTERAVGDDTNCADDTAD